MKEINKGKRKAALLFIFYGRSKSCFCSVYVNREFYVIIFYYILKDFLDLLDTFGRRKPGGR